MALSPDAAMIDIKLPTLSPRSARSGEPHQRLMAAVLQTAVDDCRSHSRRGSTTRSEVRRAMAYVASRDRRWPFSFENLCEALTLNPASLRQAMRKEPDA